MGHHFQEFLSKEIKEGDTPYKEDGTLKDEFAFDGNVLGKTFDMKVVSVENNEETAETISVTIVGIAEVPGREWIKDTSVFISTAVMKRSKTSLAISAAILSL
ncbi:hypothetical protein ACI2OX_17545 [Bacillus sp. N9]